MSKEQNKNYGKSIRTKLLNVARKENVFNQTILTRYFQERLLYRISQTHYRGNFYLKGGALMYAYEKFAARPTLDIDFLGNNISNEGSSIIAAFREICSVPYEEDGVIFDTENITAQNITEFKDYHGIRLSIPVKMDTIAQVLTMDIGFGDVVTKARANSDLILQCIEEKKRHKSVWVKIVQYHKSPLLIETHNMATEAMAKIRKEFHQKLQ